MAKINPIQAQKYLKGIDYPVSKDDLLKHAQAGGADEELYRTLEQMPGNAFQTPADVSKAIGQVNDGASNDADAKKNNKNNKKK